MDFKVFLNYALFGVMAAILIVLVIGISSKSSQKAQNLMRWRVWLQGVALFFFFLIVWSRRW